MMIPPFFTSCSSSGCTSTRSPRGLTLTAAIGFRLLLGWFWVTPATPKFGGRRQIFDQSKLVRALFWGAHACSVLVAAFCGDGLFRECDSICDNRQDKEVRDRRMRSPALRMSALPDVLSLRPITFSCSRPRLRTPHRRRRLVCRRLLQPLW